MRLTLRTLLAYLDDTLEPSQAKLIGQKVAESDTAQELIARIKQVTRRRRLTTPPPAGGPGGKIDANTIAEYLDNAVSAEQLAEVEQICLASDVHLAEVAACHQILTLVLGEPALVPPTAKQRMYGLVKGPEAIPFRKPPVRPGHEREFTDESRETDETLRLGLPPYRKGSHRLLLMGGAVVVAGLLVFAIWQVLNTLGTGNIGGAGTIVAQNDKDKDKPAPPIKEKDPETAPPDKNGAKDKAEKEKKQETDPGKDKKPNPMEEPEPAFPIKVAFQPPNTRQAQVGEYMPPTTNEKTILLQAQTNRSEWRRLGIKNPEVYSGRPLVSLPGSRSVVLLKNGIRLTLWGYLPELWPFPPVLESVAEIHYNDQPGLDLDLTLFRGRILLMNTRGDRPARVRLRFENPTNPETPEFFDIALHEKGSEALVDRWNFFPFTEPFFKDPKNANRIGPTTQLGLVAMTGELYFKSNDLTFRLEAPPRPSPSVIAWSSSKGLIGPHRLDKLPESLSASPPLPPGIKIEMRSKMLSARDELSADMTTKNADVALAEAIKSMNPFKRRLAVRFLAAIDDISSLIDALAQEDFQDVRQDSVAALQFWIASGRDAEYKLYEMLRSKYNYNAGTAGIIMDLLHTTYHSPQAQSRPETYDVLIHYLDNNVLLIRELAAWHLYRLVPAGQSIQYNPVADAAVRQEKQAEWRKLIPSGKLPPRTGP